MEDKNEVSSPRAKRSVAVEICAPVSEVLKNVRADPSESNWNKVLGEWTLAQFKLVQVVDALPEATRDYLLEKWAREAAGSDPL